MSAGATTMPPAEQAPARVAWSTEAVPAPTAGQWEVHAGLESLAAIEREWNELADAAGLFPTADARWTRCWWQAFGDGGLRPNGRRVLEVHVLRAGGRLAAVIPLLNQPGWIPKRAALSNGHVPFVAPPVAGGDSVGRHVARHLADCADLVELDRFRAGGSIAAALPDAAGSARARLVQEWRAVDPVLPIPARWRELRRRLPRNIDQDTARKRRRLERLGHLHLETVTGGPDLRAALDTCYALEARGWKGRHGSPIASRRESLRFYTQLAEEQARAGRFVLYLLELDHRVIAFEYCLRGLGQIHMLKLSFDPVLAAYSPGNVLRYRLLEHEAERGQVQAYHFGPAYRLDDWKLRWTRQAETLVRLRLYARRPGSTAAYYAGPWLRNKIRAWPAARRAVDWLRRRRSQPVLEKVPCAT